MYKENHDNDKAVDAFKHYLDLKKGKDADGEKRVIEECQALGGDCGGRDEKKNPAEEEVESNRCGSAGCRPMRSRRRARL